MGGDEVGEEPRALREPDAGYLHLPEVLQEVGDTGERTLRELATGPLQRVLEHRCDHGVELRIDGFDTGDGGLDELRGLHVAPSNELRLTGRVERGEFAHGPLPRMLLGA